MYSIFSASDIFASLRARYCMRTMRRTSRSVPMASTCGRSARRDRRWEDLSRRWFCVASRYCTRRLATLCLRVGDRMPPSGLKLAALVARDMIVGWCEFVGDVGCGVRDGPRKGGKMSLSVVAQMSAQLGSTIALSESSCTRLVVLVRLTDRPGDAVDILESYMTDLRWGELPVLLLPVPGGWSASGSALFCAPSVLMSRRRAAPDVSNWFRSSSAVRTFSILLTGDTLTHGVYIKCTRDFSVRTKYITSLVTLYLGSVSWKCFTKPAHMSLMSFFSRWETHTSRLRCGGPSNVEHRSNGVRLISL
eukprot:PhM_4_TR2598/c0_g1_i1/m.4707